MLNYDLLNATTLILPVAQTVLLVNFPLAQESEVEPHIHRFPVAHKVCLNCADDLILLH